LINMILILSFFLFAVYFNNDKRRIAYIFYGVFAIIYCFRTELGTDWPTYQEYFYRIMDTAYVEGRGFEIGYRILNLAFFYAGLSYWNLVTLISAIICVIYVISTNKYTNNFGLVFVLSLYYFFYPSLESIRASLAIVLFYYSMQYIHKESSKYWCINIIGLMFHNSALLAFVFYFFYKYPKSKIFILFAGILVCLITPFFEKVLTFLPVGVYSRFVYYFVDRYQRISILNMLSIKLVEYIVLIVLMKKTVGIERIQDKVIYNLLELGVVILITFGVISDVAYRFTYYTDWAIVLAYSRLFDMFRNRNNRIIIATTVVIYVIARFIRIPTFFTMFG